MPSLYVEIEVNAPQHKVWQALVDKQRWQEWNSYLFDRDSSVEFDRGAVVSLAFRRHAGESETWIEPRCLRVQENVCLSWVWEIPGLRCVQVFELLEIGVRRTKYIHRQEFTGFLCRVFFPFIRIDEQKGMQRMARELKGFVEHRQ